VQSSTEKIAYIRVLIVTCASNKLFVLYVSTDC